jgi:hypothetical protein
MKRSALASFAIVSCALLTIASATAESATIRLPMTAATLAMSPVNSHEVHLTSVTVNGGAITGPVAPGASVQVEFDWSVSAAPGCSGCLIVFSVGFQGKPGPCVIADGVFGGSSGHASVALTAPTTVGNQLIMVDETFAVSCTPGTAGHDGVASIVGVVLIKR